MDEDKISQNNNLKNKILNKIKAGEIHMKSKSHFIFKMILIISVAILVLMVSAFLVSYILFSLKTSGQFSLLGFGGRGITEFIIGFPWLILLVDCVLLIILDYLLKNFRIGYHYPIAYLFFGTFILILFFGFIIELTPVNGIILRIAEEQRLPIFGGFYGGLRKSHSNVGIFRGTVVSIEGNTFMLKYNDYDIDGDDMIVKVLTPQGFNVGSSLNIGDMVFVAGNLVNGEIQAYGLQKLLEN